MKVDFGPPDRTSKREVCVSFTFRAGFRGHLPAIVIERALSDARY